MTDLTLIDVLRYHERQAAESRQRSQHPLCKYETRMAWEADSDLHLMLAAAIRKHIPPAPAVKRD